MWGRSEVSALRELGSTCSACLREPPFLWLGLLSSFPVSVPSLQVGGRAAGGGGDALPSTEDGCGQDGAGLRNSGSPRPPGAGDEVGATAGAVLSLWVPFAEAAPEWRCGQRGP